MGLENALLSKRNQEIYKFCMIVLIDIKTTKPGSRQCPMKNKPYNWIRDEGFYGI